jgi:hypothetical protein
MEEPKYQEFAHPPLGEEVEAISGRFVLNREGTLTLQGREVLYLVGYGVFDTSCCGTGGTGYALVPGFFIKKRHRINDAGAEVSLVEPVRGEGLRGEIERIIKERENVPQVNFL